MRVDKIEFKDALQPDLQTALIEEIERISPLRFRGEIPKDFYAPTSWSSRLYCTRLRPDDQAIATSVNDSELKSLAQHILLGNIYGPEIVECAPETSLLNLLSTRRNMGDVWEGTVPVSILAVKDIRHYPSSAPEWMSGIDHHIPLIHIPRDDALILMATTEWKLQRDITLAKKDDGTPVVGCMTFLIPALERPKIVVVRE